MIEVRGLTKRYGAKTAVDDLTFSIEPGKVTGFLGPNGAGKTTTMRCILGLDYPDEGTVAVDGKSYPDLAYPMREVGALLDAKAVHGGRSARNHLLCLAQTNSLPKRRVAEVLEQDCCPLKGLCAQKCLVLSQGSLRSLRHSKDCRRHRNLSPKG